MKKMKYILGLFLILILTGCVKYNTEMKINNDNSVELTMTYTLQTKKLDSTKIVPSDEEGGTLIESESSSTSSFEVNIKDFEFLKKYGFSIEDFNEDLDNGTNVTGIIIYKKFKSLKDMTSNNKIVIDFTKVFQEEDKNFKYDNFFYKGNEKYNASYIFDFRADSNDNANSESIDYSSYSKMFDLQYSISFPESITNIESNATTKTDDGHKLTWNLDIGKQNSVEFSFTSDRYLTEIDKIIILSCFGAIGISILIIIIISLTKIGNKKKLIVDENIENIENLDKEQ